MNASERWSISVTRSMTERLCWIRRGAAELFAEKPAGAARGVERNGEKRARTHACGAYHMGLVALPLLGPAGILRDDACVQPRPVPRPAPGAVRGGRPAPARDQRLRSADPVGDEGRRRRPRRRGPRRSVRDTVAIGTLLVVALALVQALVRTASRLVLLGAGQQVETEIRADLFDAFLRLEPGFYQGRRTGDLMSRATNDLQSVVDARRVRPPVPRQHGDRLRRDARRHAPHGRLAHPGRPRSATRARRRGPPLQHPRPRRGGRRPGAAGAPGRPRRRRT